MELDQSRTTLTQRIGWPICLEVSNRRSYSKSNLMYCSHELLACILVVVDDDDLRLKQVIILTKLQVQQHILLKLTHNNWQNATFNAQSSSIHLFKCNFPYIYFIRSVKIGKGRSLVQWQRCPHLRLLCLSKFLPDFPKKNSYDVFSDKLCTWFDVNNNIIQGFTNGIQTSNYVK